MFNNKSDIASIDGWKTSREGRDNTHQQRYLVHWKNSIVEKWALPIFDEAGDKFEIVRTVARCEEQLGHDDCNCEICGKPESNEHEFGSDTHSDMPICDVCERCYHWTCLLKCQNTLPGCTPSGLSSAAQ
ncbi:MAG: hypothetical protein EOM68_12970 [Spirochaetia bacterium]|nr:hypothetical protein [Spirochaetia bacterium]